MTSRHDGVRSRGHADARARPTVMARALAASIPIDRASAMLGRRRGELQPKDPVART